MIPSAPVEGYRADTYGESFADVYDTWYAEVSDKAATAAFVQAQLAASPPPAGVGPRVLELGVGSGRLAGPVAETGVTVVGIDASAAMLRLLVERGEPVSAVLADMAALPFRRCFAGAFVAFNSIFNLTSAASQARCFRDVAGVVIPGGWFAVEALAPRDDADLPLSSVDVLTVAVDRVVLAVSLRSPADQTIAGQHIEIGAGGIRLRPWMVRYALPHELDQMAADAGMTLEARWAGWDRAPFAPDDRQHLSLYRVS